MASDYGDEAGGKLLDWMLRIGQEAGAEAMARSARELSERLAGIRGTIAGGRAEQVAAEGAPTYAKLSLEELSGLPEELVKLFVFGVCFINKVPFVRGMRPRVGRGPVSSWSSCAPR